MDCGVRSWQRLEREGGWHQIPPGPPLETKGWDLVLGLMESQADCDQGEGQSAVGVERSFQSQVGVGLEAKG